MIIEKEASEFVEDFLAHHGILGMKWGHHTLTGGGSVKLNPGFRESTGLSKSARLNRKARRLSRGTRFYPGINRSNKLHLTRIHNKAVKSINNDLAHLNKNETVVKSWKSGYLLGGLNHPSGRSYNNDVAKIIQKNYQKVVNETYAKKYPNHEFKVVRVNSKISGRPKFQIAINPKTSVKHAASLEVLPDIPDFEIELIKDDRGLITGVKLIEDNSLEQAEDFVKNFLAH